jgi:vacuolar-type H+-ATPase subunit E/Vma4
MTSPQEAAGRKEVLTRAVASLEEVLSTMREDPRAYAALSAAIAFVEVVLMRQGGERPTESIPPVRRPR